MAVNWNSVNFPLPKIENTGKRELDIPTIKLNKSSFVVVFKIKSYIKKKLDIKQVDILYVIIGIFPQF